MKMIIKKKEKQQINGRKKWIQQMSYLFVDLPFSCHFLCAVIVCFVGRTGKKNVKFIYCCFFFLLRFCFYLKEKFSYEIEMGFGHIVKCHRKKVILIIFVLFDKKKMYHFLLFRFKDV